MSVQSTSRLVASLAVAVVASMAASCGSTSADLGQGGDVQTSGTVQLASDGNMVANASLEDVNPVRPSYPLSWTSSAWGVNATSFKHDTSGHSGSRSVRIDVTSYTSGDAKWIFDATPVVPGKSYVYRDWYRSNVATKVVAANVQANGSTVYQTLGTVPASPGTWSTVAFATTPPTGTVRVTVYHLIAAVGTLQLDDVRLSLPQVPDLSSGVPNGSLEQAADLGTDRPLGWNTGAWGTNLSTFTYLTTGRSGSRSVAVTVSGYVNGDAKWFFDSQPVSPGTRYLFSDYYTATVQSYITARITMADGTFTYVDLGHVPASATFAPARVAFLAPAGAVAATVFHGLSTNGTLQIDDVGLVALPPVPIVNGVPNADMETPAFPGSSLPAAWRPDAWGFHDAVFSYSGEGHSGSRSLRIDITSLASGGAAWSFDAQPAVGGAAYYVSMYYRSSTSVAIQAKVTRVDGTSTLVLLPAAFPAADWTAYIGKLYVPQDAMSVTCYFEILGTGYIQIDDVGLTQVATAPFARALVSLTFDDSWLSDYTEVVPGDVWLRSDALRDHRSPRVPQSTHPGHAQGAKGARRRDWQPHADARQPAGASVQRSRLGTPVAQAVPRVEWPGDHSRLRESLRRLRRQRASGPEAVLPVPSDDGRGLQLDGRF
jgi:hypothetical protein